MQIDEDTDRDRYMSPLESKQYGLIDHVIGGDEAGFKARPRSSPVHGSSMLCEVILRGLLHTRESSMPCTLRMDAVVLIASRDAQTSCKHAAHYP